MSYAIKIVIGVAVVFGALFIHELGEYADEVNPYGHDIGSDFEEAE